VSEFFSKLFSPDFMPHGYCYLWQPGLVWLHATPDALIALSYYLIPLVLIYFVRKRTDLPFNWIFVMLGVFILACGTTHVMEVWTLWHPVYRFSGVIKAFTAVVSIRTAVMLVKSISQALALPSPTQLRTANLKLENEITERLRIEAALQRAHDELDVRVRERTVQLANATNGPILDASGYQCAIATTLAEARTLLGSQQYQLLLLERDDASANTQPNGCRGGNREVVAVTAYETLSAAATALTSTTLPVSAAKTTFDPRLLLRALGAFSARRQSCCLDYECV
jgi:hypothetical protein